MNTHYLWVDLHLLRQEYVRYASDAYFHLSLGLLFESREKGSSLDSAWIVTLS